MRAADLMNTARAFEAISTVEAERLAEAEARDIASAKAEKATLPAHHWQSRWKAEQRALAARRLRLALEEALQ